MAQSAAQQLAERSAAEQVEILSKLSDEQIEALRWDWSFWGRPEQFAPPGDWTFWLYLAGRGAGKTRSGAEWLRKQVASGAASRIAMIAETAADARDVMVEGPGGILAISPPHERPLYESSKRRLTWPNGAQATLYNATEPDQLRGPQFSHAWLDELAKFERAQEVWDQLQFGLRSGARPQAIITTTPRPIPIIRELIASKRAVITRGRTLDNADNLAESFLATVTERYGGTRLGRQELNAEVLEDVAGALWTPPMFEAKGFRVAEAPPLVRVVVAVDPSGARSAQDEDADSIGIVTVGRGMDGRAYVLADWTCRLSPQGWGERAVAAFRHFKADRIIAERNYGGAMVEHVLRSVDPSVPYLEVTASRGKIVRAEPVAALYEQGRVSHVGSSRLWEQIEGQMIAMTSDGYLGDGSPDRVDALVWAMQELMLTGPPPLNISDEFMRLAAMRA